MKLVVSGVFFATALMAQPPCAIRGAVIDALTNQPIPRAQVFVNMEPGPQRDESPPMRQVTGERGTFCFGTHVAGRYMVRATRALYADAVYGERWQGDSPGLISIAGNESSPSLQIRMFPQAVISGVLVDADGDPVQGARVQLIKKRWKAGAPMPVGIEDTKTDDRGRYRFGKLAPGAYFVAAARVASNSFGPVARNFLDETRQPFHQIEGKTYYTDTLSFRDASPVRVEAGQEIGDLNLTLRLTEARHVQGHVAANALEFHPHVLHVFDESNTVNVLGFPIQDDGAFLAEGLPPGRYLVAGPGIATTEIDLNDGSIDNLSLAPGGPVEIQITTHLDGSPPQPAPKLIELIRKDRRQHINAGPTSDNKFKVFAPPGRYEIRPASGAHPFFIKGLSIDGVRQSTTVLDLTADGPKAVDLFLSSNAVEIEGCVIGAPAPRDQITVLIEDDSSPDAIEIKRLDPSGNFQWTLLHAGTFHLYAFAEFNRDAWGDPELAALFADKSVTFDFEEGSHMRVNVPLISADEFEAALRKTGF